MFQGCRPARRVQLKGKRVKGVKWVDREVQRQHDMKLGPAGGAGGHGSISTERGCGEHRRGPVGDIWV